MDKDILKKGRELLGAIEVLEDKINTIQEDMDCLNNVSITVWASSYEAYLVDDEIKKEVIEVLVRCYEKKLERLKKEFEEL